MLGGVTSLASLGRSMPALRRARRALAFAVALAASMGAGCASSPATDAGSPVGPDAALDAFVDVDACAALATTLAERCADADAGTAATSCALRAYASLCTAGDGALLTAALRCLDDGACHTLASPGEAGRACLEALFADAEGTTAYGAYASILSACGSEPTPERFARSEVLPYLDDADATALLACATTETCSVDDVLTTCAATIPSLAPFAACLE